MGRIFTLQEIEQGKVPQLKDFEIVERFLRTTVEREKQIYGALIYGSVMRRKFNCRSDLDCLFLVGSWEGAVPVLGRIAEYARKHNVHLEPIFMSEEQARDGRHPVTPLFYKHLRLAAEGNIGENGVVKSNPLNILFPMKKRHLDEVVEYLTFQLHRLRGRQVLYRSDSEAEQMKTLQDMMAVCIHVARRIVLLRWMPGLQDDSRESVARLYRHTASEELWRTLDRIVALDESYTAELNLQLLGSSSRARYGEVLDRLAHSMRDVVSFIETNLEGIT